MKGNLFMKKILTSMALLSISTSSYSWDFGIKADAQRSSTNNVNLAETSPLSDSYSTFGGYLQAKNETFKIKLRGKREQYNSQVANDNYSTDLSMQYKHSKNDDYTFGVFKQVYDGATIISTDTTSDNSGGRLSATFSKDYDQDISGYFTINGNQKKYPKIPGRTDKIIGGAFGIEYYFSSYFMINPELNLQKNNSAVSYYSNLSFGPTLLINLTPDDHWEFFVDGSYSRINYSRRTVAIIINSETQNQNETQSLISINVGTVYKLTKIVSIQAQYSTGKNSSNNQVSAYKADVLSFGLSLKI